MLALDTLALGCMGGVLPDALRIVQVRYDPAPAYLKRPFFWLSVALQTVLGMIAVALIEPTRTVDALAIGFSAPTIISQLLATPSGGSTPNASSRPSKKKTTSSNKKKPKSKQTEENVKTNDDQNDVPTPRLTDIQPYIGRQLRAVYDDVAKPVIPERYLDLMKALEAADASVDADASRPSSHDTARPPIDDTARSTYHPASDLEQGILAQMRDWWGGRSGV